MEDERTRENTGSTEKDASKQRIAPAEKGALAGWKPKKDVPPDHEAATATICIDGLSVLCPTVSKNAVDIAFIEADHTPFEIVVFRGTGCEEEWRYDYDGRKVRIEITKTSPKGVGYFYEKPAGKDDEDSSWMPDLETLHSGPLTPRKGAERFLSVLLRLQDAVFHTRLRSVNDGTFTDINSSATIPVSRIGRVLGADIVCDRADTGVEIRVYAKDSAGQEVVVEGFSMPKESGPYVVCAGTSTTTPEKDHLHHIYHHILEVSDGKQFEFRYKKEELPFTYCTYPRDAFNIKTTEFACQTFGGGEGPLPQLP